MASDIWPAMPEAVRAQLDAFLAELREMVGENLVGLYLHGSLAMSGFNPARSDLDLLAITAEALTSAARQAVAALLLRRSGQPCPIEISFLQRSHLAPWRYPTPFDLHYSEAWRTKYEAMLASADARLWAPATQGDEACDSDLAAHLTVAWARGVCLWGAPIADTLPQPPREDYLSSLAEDLDWALAQWAELPEYVVLNLCRTLAYLREGSVLSKAEGGTWALAHLPPALQPPIRAALAAYAAPIGERGAWAAPEVLKPLVAALRTLLKEAGFPA